MLFPCRPDKCRDPTLEFVLAVVKKLSDCAAAHLIFKASFGRNCRMRVALGCVGLRWVALGWVGLGWVGLGVLFWRGYSILKNPVREINKVRVEGRTHLIVATYCDGGNVSQRRAGSQMAYGQRLLVHQFYHFVLLE